MHNLGLQRCKSAVNKIIWKRLISVHKILTFSSKCEVLGLVLVLIGGGCDDDGGSGGGGWSYGGGGGCDSD